MALADAGQWLHAPFLERYVEIPETAMSAYGDAWTVCFGKGVWVAQAGASDRTMVQGCGYSPTNEDICGVMQRTGSELQRLCVF